MYEIWFRAGTNKNDIVKTLKSIKTDNNKCKIVLYVLNYVKYYIGDVWKSQVFQKSNETVP